MSLDSVLCWNPERCQIDKKRLEKDGRGVWRLRTLSSVCLGADHVVTLNASAYSARSGRYEPFALRTSSSRQQLVLCSWDRSMRISLDVPVNLPISSAQLGMEWITSGTVAISSGPSVIGHSNDTLFIAFPLYKDTPQLTLSSSELYDLAAVGRGGGVVIDNVWSFDWMKCGVLEPGTHVSILLVLKCHHQAASPSTNHVLIFLRVYITDRGVCHAVLPKSAVPQEYAAIIQCLTVNWILSIDAATATPLMKPQFILGSSYNQVVLVEEGSITSCIDVGATPISVCAVQAGGSCGVVVVCQLTQEKVLAYKCGPHQSWEREEWCGVSDVFVGDFMRCGSEQLLMLLNDDTGDFVVTDFNGIQHSSREHTQAEHVSTDEEAPPALRNALAALKVRRLQGEAQLDSARRKLQKKYDLLSNGLQLLKQIGTWAETGEEGGGVVPQPPSTQCDQSLMCLVPGSPELCESTVTDGAATTTTAADAATEPRLQLCDSWQRIVDGQWTIAVSVRNTSSVDMLGLSLSLSIPASSDTQRSSGPSKSLIVMINRPCKKSKSSGISSSECNQGPPFKKIRKESLETKADESGVVDGRSVLEDLKDRVVPGQGSACIVVSTPLPSFTTDSVHAVVLASWIKKVEGGGEMEKDFRLRSTQLCSVVLTAGDVCSQELMCSPDCLKLWTGNSFMSSSECSNNRDLACILGCREVSKIAVSSTHTNLLCLPGMLRNRLPQCVVVLDSTITTPTGSTFPATPSPLSGTAVYCVCNPHSAMVKVLHCSRQQFSLLLQLMSTSLPHDVSCEEDNDNVDRAALASGLESLRKKLLNLLADTD